METVKGAEQKPLVGPGANVGAPQHTPTPSIPVGPLPAKPPHNGLLKLGINASIDQVNQAVQQTTDAHRNLFGTNPKPGLIFDVIRGVGNGTVKDVNHLFDLPMTPQEVAVRHLAGQIPLPNTEPPSVSAEVEKQLQGVSPKALQHLQSMGIDPVKLLSMSPDKREVYIEQASRAQINTKREDIIRQTRLMNLGSEFTVFGRAASQISQGIKDIPDGIAHLAVAAGKDTSDIASWPAYLLNEPYKGTPLDQRIHPKAPTHLARIGLGMGKSITEDFLHPKQRIGYLTMDIASLFTFGISGAARVASAAGRVAELGEDASALSRASTFAREVAKRPYHPPIKVGFGAYQAYVPAFDNVVLYKLQQNVLNRFNVRMMNAHAPEAAFSTGRNTALYDFLLSPERWTKRFMDNNQRIDLAIDTFPAHELTRLNQWQARADDFWNNLTQERDLNAARQSLRKTDHPGMQKLIQLVFTEDPNPISTWRSFHERNIADAEQAIQDIEGLDKPAREVRASIKKQTRIITNHKAHLGAIDRAVELLNDPTPMVRKIVDKAYEVSDKQAQIKRQILGYDPQIMDEHNSMVAAIARGEHIVGEPGERGILEEGQVADKELEKRVNRAQNKLNNEKRKMTTLENNLAKPSRKTGAIMDRPALRAALDRQRDAVSAATDELLVARHHREILGSYKAPLNIYERNGEAIPLISDRYDRALSREGKLAGALVKTEDLLDALHLDFREIGGKQTSLANDIRRRGFDNPIDLDYDYENHTITVGNGNHRVLAAHEAGVPYVPVIFGTMGDSVKSFYEHVRETARGKHEVARTKPVEEMDPKVRAKFEKQTTYVNREGKTVPLQPSGYGFPLQRKAGEESSSLEIARAIGLEAHPITRRGMTTSDLMVDDPAIAELRNGREPGYISTRTPLREGENKAFGRISRGKFGLRKPRVTVYRMDGKTLQMGDNLMDMSELLSSELTRAVKASMEVKKWQGIWDSAMSTAEYNRLYPDDDNYMSPVRDIRSVPTHLKKYVQAMDRQRIDRKMIDRMGEDEEMRELREWLYPNKADILKEGDPHVRWMDERFFADTIDRNFWIKADRLAGNLMAPINEPMRFLLIFGTPAYMLNALGSAALLATKQGFASIPNLGRSFAASRIYGGEVSRFLDTLGGTTHTGSLETEVNRLTFGSRKIAAAWQRATDTYFRRAAVIGRLREAGHLKDEMSPEDLLKTLTAPENRIEVRQAAQLARADMLDFDKMTWPEKATLRHLVFVYAFMRAGSIYSVRWLLEHPVQADVLEHVGEDRKKEIERLVGKTPSWFLNENYFPIGHDTVLNGVQLNIPDTLNQLAYPLAGFANVPYESLLDLAGPSASLLYESITGTQAGGKQIQNRTGFRPADALIDLFSQTPPGFFLKDKQQKNAKLPPPAVTAGTYDPISAAHSEESAAIKQPTMDQTNLWGGWGSVLLRSALPRHPNQAGMAARYWRDLRNTDPQAWAQHQIDLVMQMVGRQSKALGEPVPQGVKDAVRLVAERELYISDQKKAWEKRHGGTYDNAGNRQLAKWTIDFLSKNAYLDKGQIKEARSALDQAQDSRQAELIWKGALRLAGTKPWEQWVQKADAVDWFNHEGYPDVLASLKERKLGDYTDSATADEKTKWSYGRQFAAYTDRIHQFTEQIARAKRSTEAAVIRADMKDFIERHDKPVTINGKTFPSPVRVAFARLSPQAQADKVMSAATTGWTTLDSFSKELLGHPSDPDATYGYRNLTTWIDDYKRDHPGENPPGWLKKGYIDYLEKKLPGFKADYQFSRQTTAYRLSQLKPFKQSEYASTWSELFKLADDRARSLKKAGYTKTGINDQWSVYDLPKVQEWLNKQPIGYRRELARWTASHPHFLQQLVK